MDFHYKGETSNTTESLEKVIDIKYSIDRTLEEKTRCIEKDILAIQNGENVFESFQHISNELLSANNNNLSINTLEKAGIGQLIFPFLNLDQDYELLRVLLSILNKLVMKDQSEDSPFLNETFLGNLLSLFQSDFFSIKIQIIEIILNLLHDSNISENIFQALSQLNFLQEIANCAFFQTTFLWRMIPVDQKLNALSCPSEILSMFAQFYSVEDVICMIEYIPFLSSSLTMKDYNYDIRSNYAETLAYILRNPETHVVAFESKVPENCVSSLCQYHDPSLIKVWKCISNLIEFNDNIPAFLSKTFQSICTHLLESPYTHNQEIINFHLPILHFLDLYLPKYFNQIESINFVQILADIVVYESQPFVLRIPASLILIKCIYSSDLQYLQFLIDKHCFSFLFENIASYENEDLVYILETVMQVYNKYPEMQAYFNENPEFRDMLDDLNSNPHEKVTQFLAFFNLQE